MIPSAKIKELAARKRRGGQQVTKPALIPAPMGGINTVSPMTLMPTEDCIYSFNLFPSRYGLRSRPGFYKWCQPIPLGDTGVRTIIPINGIVGSGIQDRLFVATSDGIYEATIAGAVPVKRQDFAIKTGQAGYISWHNYANAAGTQFVLICDYENGYYIYDVVANSFSKPTAGGGAGQVAGGDPAKFIFVTVWKSRLWFVLKDSTTAYYMDEIGTITGKVIPFYFGSKFKYGGFLKGLWNWTQDGGAGIDDHLVGISSQGDVVVYTGYDPTTASGEGAFQLRGVWFLGKTPAGHRFVLEEGGDLLILTAEGMLSLSQLTAGLAMEDERIFYFTRKINSLIRLTFDQREATFGYEVNTAPRYSAVFLVQPKLTGERYLQWTYSYETKGWFMFRDDPIITVENWGTQVYFGDNLNNIWVFDGPADFVDSAVPGSGTPVEFSLLTSYQAYETPAQKKRVHMLRPYWIGEALPQFGAEARYDFEVAETGMVPPFVPPGGSLWDLSNWDNAVWGGGYAIQKNIIGATGMGQYIALAMRGNSVGQSAFMGCDIMFDVGGFF